MGRPKTEKHTHPRDYDSWRSMKARCYNPNANGYENYGGRGIRVCARWKHSFSKFLLDMGTRPEGTTLDREDNDGNYEPSNCRWATAKEQNENRSSTLLVTINDETRCLKDWGNINGIPQPTIAARVAKGWDLEKACTTPATPPKELIVNGVSRPIADWASSLGVPATTIHSRLNYGWTTEQACTTPKGKKRGNYGIQ